MRELWGVEHAVLFEACERKLTGESEREREIWRETGGCERRRARADKGEKGWEDLFLKCQ